MIRAAITSIGSYAPEDVITNDDLSKIVDTNDEWIMTRVGIKERHILKGEGQGTSVMGIKAVKQLMKKTKVNPEEIEVVIFATTTPDYGFPSSAILLSDACGFKNAFAFDIQGACAGFLYALEIGSNFIQSGKYKKIIVVAGDKMTSITDYTDRATCPLFGDAAGAVLLEATTENLGIMDTILRIDGSGVQYLNMMGGGSAYPVSAETIAKKMHYVHQEGQTVFKHAVKNMSDVCVEIMKKNNLTKDDINWFVPHQANIRIIEAAANRMGISKEKVAINIQRYGNTSAGTIPMCLAEIEPKLKKGDNIILTAFGAGFTWGAIYLKWGF